MIDRLYRLILIIVTCLTGCKNPTADIQQSFYYVDSKYGNDDNSGRKPHEAWKTLNRASNQKYPAGSILLLSPENTIQGSLKITDLEGTGQAPIRITSAGKKMARIESGDSSAILAINCKYLKIRNIQVAGSGRLTGNKSNGIQLINCQFSETDSVSANGYLYSGIQVTGGNDIRITHSKVFENGFCGINAESGEKEYGTDGSAYKTMKRLYIGYCVAYNNPGCPVIKDNHSGNGILIGGVTNGLIEYCEAYNNGWDMPREGNGPVGIWAYMSDSVIIQHCYSHQNKTSAKGKDGGGFDFDGGMRYSVMQYNLSAFNEGAGYGIFQYGGAGIWKDNIVRFNISYNDGSKNGQCGILVWCEPGDTGMSDFHCYNNTVVNSYLYGVNFEPGAYKGFLFENNILEVTAVTKKIIGGNFTMATFDRNLYWSDHDNERDQPEERIDKKAVYHDPKLILPSDSALLEDPLRTTGLKYFRLQESSVCINSGNRISDNGGYDFWRTSIHPDAVPNIGAWQGK
jgi:hypothetical protein